MSTQESELEAYLQTLDGTALRALELLGSGVTQEQTASHLGCDPSYISQLMTNDHFRGQVQQLKYEKLQRSAKLDNAYDEMEEQIQAKLAAAIPALYKPRDILDFATRINQMKRRAADVTNTQPKNAIVELHLPVAFLKMVEQREVVIDSVTNRVLEASGQAMQTIQSGQLAQHTTRLLNSKEIENVEVRTPGQASSSGPSKSTSYPSKNQISVSDLT